MLRKSMAAGLALGAAFFCFLQTHRCFLNIPAKKPSLVFARAVTAQVVRAMVLSPLEFQLPCRT